MKTKHPIEKLCDELTEKEKFKFIDLIVFIITGFAIMLDTIKMAIKYIFLEKITCKNRKRKTKKQK